VRSLALVGAVRLGLWLLPFDTVRRILARLTPRGIEVRRIGCFPAERLAWAVRVVSRFVPRATCLTQALAAHILLNREGYASALQIGVSKDEKGAFEAHAWLESQGKVVIGEHEAGKYAPLACLGEDQGPFCGRS
jgi:hypothetical protein